MGQIRWASQRERVNIHAQFSAWVQNDFPERIDWIFFLFSNRKPHCVYTASTNSLQCLSFTKCMYQIKIYSQVKLFLWSITPFKAFVEITKQKYFASLSKFYVVHFLKVYFQALLEIWSKEMKALLWWCLPISHI